MSETFGRYQLVRKLATGGMGQVFLARQKGPVGFEKLLVVKRVLPHLSGEDEFIQMFLDEARIAAVLNHPNIAQIYDLGEVDDVYFIAMEYVHGESVRDLIRHARSVGREIPLGLKCRIIAEAAAGLHFAHQAKSASGKSLGLIHRDVSPQNILVGFNGSVKLIDFGVAKATGKISHTLTGTIRGKYPYMSPEQARGDELDLRSDVFGLGIVFYEFLTGTRLFKRDTETATLRAVVGSKILPPSKLAKGIPKQLDAIALKALARDRRERFQSAGEFEVAIEEFVGDLRLAFSSAHLSNFMHELYARQLAKERATEDIPGVDDPTVAQDAAGANRRAVQTPSNKRLSFDEIADQRLSTGPRLAALKTPTPSQPGASTTPVTQPRAPSVDPIGPSELEARVQAAAQTDKVSGLFFNAVIARAEEQGISMPAALLSAKDKQPYRDPFSYPTADFLRLLWTTAGLMASSSKDPARAFFDMGAASMERLLKSPSGQPLSQISHSLSTPEFCPPLLSALQPLISPGQRTVEDATLSGATLTYHRDLLPAEYHAGLLTTAFLKLKKVAARVEHEWLTAGSLRVRIYWEAIGGEQN